MSEALLALAFNRPETRRGKVAVIDDLSFDYAEIEIRNQKRVQPRPVLITSFEKGRIYRKKWNAANREKIKVYLKKWSEVNRDRIRACQKRWEEANREKRKIGAKKWRDENKESIKGYMKKWQEENKQKRKEYARNYYYEKKEAFIALYGIEAWHKLNREKKKNAKKNND